MAIHVTLSVWTAGLGVHTHPVPSCSNLHKWWLSQIEWPGCQALHLSNWGLMTDLLFHNVSLCPGHFVLYHLFSHCSFSQFPSLFSHFCWLYCPLFQQTCPFHHSYGRHDLLNQIESVRVILLVWSLRPGLLLKNILIGGVPRCTPGWERASSSLYHTYLSLKTSVYSRQPWFLQKPIICAITKSECILSSI